ncbi:MAG: hypothetical protein ACRC6K_08200 [Fusobacteriaceae bacterium]
MKENNEDLRNYGKTVYSSKQFVTEKFIGGNLSKKSRNIALLNKKHILFLAYLLINTSDITKAIVKYLLELEELASNDLKANTIEQSTSDRADLRKKIEFLQSQFTEAQPLIEFAKIVHNFEIQGFNQ